MLNRFNVSWWLTIFNTKQLELQITPNIWKPKIQSRISSLTRHYCIAISMHKICSIQKFNLEIQYIIWVPWTNRPHPFLTISTQKSLSNSSFPEKPACKKQFPHQFILEIEPILESPDKHDHTHFWQPKKLSIKF